MPLEADRVSMLKFQCLQKVYSGSAELALLNTGMICPLLRRSKLHPQLFSPGEKGARNLVPSPAGRGLG
jgi:hypothetical protein